MSNPRLDIDAFTAEIGLMTNEWHSSIVFREILIPDG